MVFRLFVGAQPGAVGGSAKHSTVCGGRDVSCSAGVKGLAFIGA